MSSSWQTVVALSVVALAVVWLTRNAIRNSRRPGCGSEGCGAVSPDAKALLRRLSKR